MKIRSILITGLILLFTACSKPPPKILIIGDSISIGYTPFVIETLGDQAIVTHNEGNAQHTGTGLEKLADWIGEEDWDIVQFNWGLWDLAYRHENSTVQGKRDKINGTVTFTPDQYKANLDSLVGLLKTLTNAKLLFVSTSYVPEGEAGRYVKDALVYNEAAFEVMKSQYVPVNDIYDFSKEVHKEYSTGTDNVHYTKEGYSLLAGKITEGLSLLDRRLKKAIR